MKSVTFEAGGRELALRMDMNALVRYQDRSGETISAAIDAIMKDGWDMLRGRRLFWASLTTRMTEDEAGDVMSEIGIGRAMELAGEALRYAIRALNGQSDDADGEAEAGNAPKPRKKAT
jgi:hypothetical protein